MIIKDYHAIDGLHIKFLSIEPSIPKFFFACASDKRDFESIPIYIAEKAPRSDWIAFQAVIFPRYQLILVREHTDDGGICFFIYL